MTINSDGVNVISGKLDDGQIIVDIKDKGVARLVLNGAEIKCSDNAPICVKNAGKTIVSLEEGTENSIIDGEKYVLDDASTDEPNSAIYSKDNLSVNGTKKDDNKKGQFGNKDNNTNINTEIIQEGTQSAKAIKSSKDIGIDGCPNGNPEGFKRPEREEMESIQ